MSIFRKWIMEALPPEARKHSLWQTPNERWLNEACERRERVRKGYQEAQR